jgi:signal transduction histidine kinase
MPLWTLYLAFAAVSIALYEVKLDDARLFAYPAFTLIAFVVFCAGVRRHRPAPALGFWLFGAGILATGLGDVIYTLYEPLLGREIPYPSIADVPYIAAYALWSAGVLLLIRGPRGTRDVAGWIDTAIAVIAFTLLEFIFLIYPYFTDASQPLISRVVSSAYPVGDLLILAVLIRLLVSSVSKTLAFRFLVVGFLATFASDAVYGVLALHGSYDGGLIDIGWMVAYALFAAAALHPSIRTLAQTARDPAYSLSRKRLVTLGACALVTPGLFAWVGGRALAVPLVLAISLGAAALFLLVIARMTGLIGRLDASMRDLEKSHAARAALLKRTLRISESDRARLAAELHDGALQGLTAISYRVDALRGRLADAAEQQLVADVQAGLVKEIADLRRMMSELRPGSLVERGLGASLRDYAAVLTRDSGVECRIDVHLPTRPEVQVETVLYRIAQEAILNAIMHGRPHHIDVSLRNGGSSVELEVRDDGLGFAVDGGGLEDHLGLLAMRAYVEMAGGSVWVRSRIGDGTTVGASIPIEVR